MFLIHLVRREIGSSLKFLIFMALISGISNAMILAVINSAAENVTNEEANTRFFLIYMVAIVLFILSQKYILNKTTMIVENVIEKIRVRTANKIRHTNLETIERLGGTDIYSRLTKDANQLSSTAPIVVSSLQSFIMLFFSSIYVITISTSAFFIILLGAVGAALAYEVKRKDVMRVLQKTLDVELGFFRKLEHIIMGFKEIKVNQKKNDDIFADYKKSAQEVKKLKIKVTAIFNSNAVFSQSIFYILIAVIVFIMPLFVESYSDTIMKITASVLFIIGPIGSIVGSIPTYSMGNTAANNLQKLEIDLEESLSEEMLENLNDNDYVYTDEIITADFNKEIKLSNIEFEYKDNTKNTAYKLGPINLSVYKGEILFIMGGNGSGKSTLLKILTGLYPSTGDIYVDDNKVINTYNDDFRELFSLIFTDFHLFDKIYGLEVIDKKRINELLRLLELAEKTQYKNGKFNNLRLSTGQRKRLAMLIAFLEDKDIFVFDEVAADQDPQFRKFFYESILPELQAGGKTIIAVTHDDHYQHIANRIVVMREGKIGEIIEQKKKKSDK